MHDINLLPWREQQQAQNKQRFYMLLGLGFIIVVVLQWFASLYLDHQQTYQQQRNQQLVVYIGKLNSDLAKLKKIEQQQANITNRLNIVYSLQQDRNNTIDLMNLMSKLIPEGVYIDNIQMTQALSSQNIAMISGLADNTSRIAVMLSSFEMTPEISVVDIHSIISGKQVHTQKYQRFNLSFQFTNLVLTPKLTSKR